MRPRIKRENVIINDVNTNGNNIDIVKLYHKELGFPKNIFIQERFVRLNYSYHSLKASLSDRYGKIDLPENITIRRNEIIELETLNDKLNKLVLRTSYNDNFDLIIVLLIQGSKVKTVWLNEKSDSHTTLDASKYITEFYG